MTTRTKSKTEMPQLNVIGTENLPIVSAAPLSPAVKPAPKRFARAKAFDSLVEVLDWLAEDRAKLVKHKHALQQVYCARETVKKAVVFLEMNFCTPSQIAKTSADLDAFREENGASADGCIGDGVIAMEVAKLLGAYPNAAPGDPEIYTATIMDEIAALDPTIEILRSATSKLKRESKFVPSVAEVVAAVSECEGAWEDRWAALCPVDGLISELRTSCERHTAKLDAEDARQAEYKKPLEPGHRVRFQEYEAKGSTGAWVTYYGTVFEGVDLEGVTNAKPHFWIDCDKYGRRCHKASDLSRVLPGDKGYDPPTRILEGDRVMCRGTYGTVQDIRDLDFEAGQTFGILFEGHEDKGEIGVWAFPDGSPMSKNGSQIELVHYVERAVTFRDHTTD